MVLHRLLIKQKGSLYVVSIIPKYVAEWVSLLFGRQFWWVLVFCMSSRHVLLFWQTTGTSDCLNMLLLSVNFCDSDSEQQKIAVRFFSSFLAKLFFSHVTELLFKHIHFSWQNNLQMWILNVPSHNMYIECIRYFIIYFGVYPEDIVY